jgi:hypothetical protein
MSPVHVGSSFHIRSGAPLLLVQIHAEGGVTRLQYAFIHALYMPLKPHACLLFATS